MNSSAPSSVSVDAPRTSTYAVGIVRVGDRQRDPRIRAQVARLRAAERGVEGRLPSRTSTHTGVTCG